VTEPLLKGRLLKTKIKLKQSQVGGGGQEAGLKLRYKKPVQALSSAGWMEGVWRREPSLTKGGISGGSTQGRQRT